jgi:predicted GNAT family N-acyltransferase
MFHTQLASQSEMRLEQMDNGSTEVKWCIFTKGMRGPIAKIIVDTRQTKLVLDESAQNMNKSAHIVNVFVRPEFRGKQLGEHLVRLAQVAMKDNGFHWLTLDAEENVEFHGTLVKLYERCGFEIHPIQETYPMEYNDDECFRKVPMRCNLALMSFNATTPEVSATTTTTTTTTTPISGPRVHNLSGDNRYRTISFVEELKREALQILAQSAMNVDIPMALEWIDSHLSPGTMEHALRTGTHIRTLGHPDWMELAGYLIHLGKIQEKYTSWHAPFMVEIHPATPVTSANTDDEDEDEDSDYALPSSVKSGPLPVELCELNASQNFIDPERYTQQGVDETVLTWGPCEYAYTALEFAGKSSAPHEMSQVLRYCQVDTWLKTEDFAYLESWGDADLKQLTLRFKESMDGAVVPLQNKQMDEAKARFLELVDKYVSEVRMM